MGRTWGRRHISGGGDSTARHRVSGACMGAWRQQGCDAAAWAKGSAEAVPVRHRLAEGESGRGVIVESYENRKCEGSLAGSDTV